MKAHTYHTATTRAAARLDRRNRAAAVAGPPDLFGNPIPIPAAPPPGEAPPPAPPDTDAFYGVFPEDLDTIFLAVS